MAKEQNQTQTDDDNEAQDTTGAAATADVEAVKEDKISTAKAVKTSSDFDKRIDEEGVVGEEPEPDSSDKAGDEDTAGKAKADKGAKTKGDDQDTAGDEGAEGKPDADKGDKESPLSKEVVTRAANLGLTPEEIQTFETDADLTRSLNILDGIIADTGAEEQATTTQPPAGAKDKAAEVKDDGFKLEFKNEAGLGIMSVVRDDIIHEIADRFPDAVLV